MPWLDDPSAGAWIRLADSLSDVASFVPRTFDSFARVFLPVYVASAGRSMRWAETAALNGRTMHPTVRLVDVLFREDDVVESSSVVFSGQTVGIAQPEWTAVCGVLRAHTSASTVFLGFWDGWDVERVSGPRELLELPHRSYVLYELALDDLDAARDLNPGLGPNLAWPADRAWFVNTDLDIPTTYVGGSADAIEAILRCADLESAPAAPDDPAW